MDLADTHSYYVLRSLLRALAQPYVKGRQWDRIDRFEGPLKDAKRIEAVLEGHSAEDVLHDLQWHDMTKALEHGGRNSALSITSALTHCQSVLGYAVRVVAAAERSQLVEMRSRIRDLVRVFCGPCAEKACELISQLIERDGEGDPVDAPRAAIAKLELDDDPRQRAFACVRADHFPNIAHGSFDQVVRHARKQIRRLLVAF